MKKKRLFLAGFSTRYSKPMIERAQKLGYEVLLGDVEDNLTSKAQLISDADRLIVVDCTNYEDLSTVTLRLQEEAPLDALCTFKEDGLLVTARVAQDNQLVGNRPDVVEACINKFTTHNLLKHAGMLSPAYALCSTLDEVKAFYEQVDAPIVIKPHNLQASIGVMKVESKDELEVAFNACRANCREPLVLVEEFLVGREISLEAMVYHGKAVLFGVTEKCLYPGTFIESGHISPDSGREMSRTEYEKHVQKVVDAVGITYGPLHIEGFHTRQGFVIGEIHTRYGGDHILTLTELAMKCDMISPVFAELGGDIPYEISFGEPQEVAGVRFLDVKPGVITTIEGIEEVKKLPGVAIVEIGHKPGDVIRPLCSSFDRAGCIVARAATREELENTFKQALCLLNIVTVDEIPMSLTTFVSQAVM